MVKGEFMCYMELKSVSDGKLNQIERKEGKFEFIFHSDEGRIQMTEAQGRCLEFVCLNLQASSIVIGA